MATTNERRTMTRLSMVAGSAATLAAAWVGVIRVDTAPAQPPRDAALEAALAAQSITPAPATPAPAAAATATAAAPSVTAPRGSTPAPAALVPAPAATSVVPAPTVAPTMVPTTAPTPAPTPRTVITRRSRAS